MMRQRKSISDKLQNSIRIFAQRSKEHSVSWADTRNECFAMPFFVFFFCTVNIKRTLSPS